MELRQRIENDFLKRYIQDKTTVRSDNTRTRFTEAQKIRVRRPNGNFTKSESAVLKSEAKSADRYINAEKERQDTVVDRIRKRRKAQEEYDKAARRLHKKEKEYWETKQPEVENDKDDSSELARDAQIKEGDAEYEKEYEKWKRDFGFAYPGAEAAGRFSFWLKSTIGNLFKDATDVHMGDLNGKIAEADIDIQAAEAHRQMSNLQRQKSNLQKEYLDYLGQLQDKQFLGQSITQDDENHLGKLSSSLNNIQKQIDNTDLQQLDKMYKYQFARDRGWVGGFFGARGQDIWDAVSTTAILASDEDRGKAQRRKQRLDEGVAAYDANIEDYAEDYLNRKNAYSYTGVKTVSPQQKTKEEREDAVIDDYIKGKDTYRKLRREDKINTAVLQQNVGKVFDVANGYKKLSNAYQNDALWSPGYWQYCMAGMIGSSNSSPSQLLANTAQTASMFAGPGIYTAATLATTPLQIQGGLDENYAEIGDKRIDNILAELEKPSNSKIAPYIIADLVKQSKLYWKGQGMDDAWIKERTEGDNGIHNVLSDLTSGAIHNNSPLIKEALLTSTKGLRAQRQADNVRTMWETGQQTMLQVMPIDKALSATFKLARNKAKSIISLRGSNAASGEINASIQSGVRNATHDASRYANGFRRGNTLDSFREGYNAASEAAEAAGMGGAGSIYYGVLGGTTRASAHLLKKANPEFGVWANNVEEMLMHKYQYVIDKLTPESGWSKLAVRYGLRAIPRMLKQSLSEGSEEGVQYLNSKQDFASAYGYDGADFGELISNDMELGSRVASAYLSLLGMGKSELYDDQEFWNNVKGGFALGAHNPGIAQIGTMYSSIHGAMQEMGATEAITRFAIVNREQERLNRVSNIALAREAMSGRGRAVVEELERMQQADSRRETPRFQQEWYDEKIEDANRIHNLANDKGLRAKLERNGIQYGTDRYAVAIADLYDLHRQAEANNEEYKQTETELDKAYQSKELNEELDKVVNDDIVANTEFSAKLNRAQSEAANQVQIALETEAAQNGEDINSEEFKEIVELERKHAQDEVLEQFKNRRKKELIRNIRNLTQGKAILKIMAQSNSIKDVFDFIENKTGLRTKRPDAKIIEEFIRTKIKNLKSSLHAVDEKFDENSTDEQTLEYLNKIELPNANIENIEDLELASNMIAVDASITKTYMSLLDESPKKGEDGSKSKYGRRVDAIIEANDRNEKLNWFVNDAYSGDAVNKLNDVLEEELRKEFEEELKKTKKAKDSKVPSPVETSSTTDESTKTDSTTNAPAVDDSTATESETVDTEALKKAKAEKLKSNLSKNKRKAQERIAKAKQRYQKRYRKLHGKRLHMEVIPYTWILDIANGLFTAAEMGTYKIAQFITDLKDVLDSELNKETLDNAKRAYNTKATKFKYKHPELADNVSNADEIVNYTESTPTVEKKAYIAPVVSTIEPWEYISKILSEKQKNIDNELSTYYDTIVVEDGEVKIYTNTAEFESRSQSKSESEYLRNLEDEIAQSNTSVESFENKLEQLGVSKEYSKYRNVKGIYGVIARARLLQNNENNDSLQLAKRVRQFAIDCFLGRDIEQYSDIDPTGEHAAKLKKYAEDCKKIGLHILSADNMIYGNGKSSQLDLLLIDSEGNLHVIDVLQSIDEIHSAWDRVVRPMVVSKREREEKMLKQLNEILNSYSRFNVVSSSVIPINCTDRNHITGVEDRIRVDVKRDKSISYNTEFYNDSVDKLNSLIEDYNSLADECRKYDIPFARINKFDAPKPISDAENQQLCSTVSSMLEEVKMKYEEVTEKLKDSIETERFVYSQFVPQFSTEEYSSMDNMNMLFSTCRDLDYMINMVPTGPVTTNREKTILNTFLTIVQQAEDALNTVLQDPNIDSINIRQEQELIASAMEKIAKNRDYYGSPAIEVAKWWLIKFTLTTPNTDDNQTASVGNMQMLLNGYYDAIESWTDVLREHILKDLDDDIILQRWYSALLNNYFTKLIDNAQKVVNYLNEHQYTDPTMDVEMPNAVQSVINNANSLIKEFNDSYGVDPDEIYSTPPKDKIEEINRMPITWNSPIGKSKSYSPAFDKMAGGMNQEGKYRTWAMIYQKMSVNPDFLEKAYFEFSNDGDDIKVFIRYNGLSCYLPFITDLNNYPKGSLSKDENIELHKLHLIKVTNKAKQKFISKIKAMLAYIKDHPEYRISVLKSLNKGSLIYNKPGQPKSLHNVQEFLFSGQNAKDLYTVRMSSNDGIGFLIKKNVGTPRESWGVWCGENLQTPIRQFDPEYIKDPIDFYNGAILFNFNTGNDQKIPALIDRTPFSKQEAESLANLIKMYIDGHDYINGYPILDLLKMRLYLYDQHAVKSQCNNCGNIITIDRIGKQVIIGNESAYNVADKYNQLVQRLQKMPNMIDASLVNEQFMYSQFSVFSQMRSAFSNNASLQKIELPNGLTVTRDDFVRQNPDSSRGTTWLGYLLRNGILATPVTGMSYKQINFSDPKLVLKEEVDTDEKVREDIQKKQEQAEKQTDVQDLISKMAASFLDMDVEASELVERTDEEVSEFKKTAEEYFDTVFGSHDDLSIVSSIQSANAGSRVAAGVCAAQYVKLATNAPESAIFHEAFHKIIELVLPSDQRESFYAMYRDKYGKDLSDRDVAEGLCDLFVDYMNLKMQHKRAKGFGKIYSWFKKIAFNIGMCIKFGLTNSIKFYQLHQDINRGKYANKQVSKENIDRFNSIFKTKSGVSELYYTVENTDKKDSRVNFENITNAAELQDLASSIGFMIIKAYGLESIGADPSVIKVNEHTPKMLLEWLKKDKFTPHTLGKFHPALEEVFEENVREVKIKDKVVKQKYYPKFEAIQKLVSDYLSYITGGYRGKFRNLPENEDEDEEIVPSRSNVFDRVSYEFSKLESATERAKFFISTIPYMNNDRSLDTTRNSMNFFSFMPIQEVFGTLIHETNESSSIQDLLQRLQRSAHIDAMHAYVYAKYKKLVDGMYTYNEDGSIKSIDYDKESFAIEILNLLRGQDIDFIIAKSITKSEDQGKEVYITNSSLERDSRQYPTEWTQFVLSGQVPILNTTQDSNGNYTVRNGKQDSFRNVANFFYDLIDGLKTDKTFTLNGVEYNQVVPQDLKYLKSQIVKQLYSIGILFPINALEHLLKTKYSVEDESGDSFGGIKRWLQSRGTSSIYPFLTQLEQFVSKTGVVNQKLINKGYTNTGFVKELGNALGSYNRLHVQQMSLGLNGKKLYPVSQNSSISYIVSQLNTLNPENDLIHTLIGYSYVYDDSDGFPKGSILLKQILDKGSTAHFNLHTYIGFRTDTRGDSGVEYSDQSTIDDYVAKMAMLQNGFWISSTLADKGTWVCMDGVKIPGMEFKQKEVKNENDEVVGTTTAIDGIPTIQYVNGQYIIRPSDTVLDQMIEYARTELLSIQQCMEDLGYDNIPGYKKQGRPKLKESAKIKNYHTENKSGVEPNGTRFLALTQVIVVENGTFKVKNLNDPNKSSVDMLKDAYKYFFSKSLEEQRDIMTYILNARRADAVRYTEQIGLIERKEISFTANGNTKTLYKATDKRNTLFNLTSKHMNMSQVDALADAFMVQQGWDKIKHYAERNATREMCKSMAIAAILQDVTTRAAMCGEEMKRCFCGNPAFFKVDYDMQNGIIRDSTYDLQKRIGGLISTGDDNAQNLYGISEEYVCAECNDYEIGSDSDIAPRLEKMFKDSAVRETYAFITGDWKNAYEKPIEWIYEDIETTFSKDEKLRIENAIKNAKQFSDAYTKKINVADGAAYITDTMCENMLRKRGAYSGVKKAFDILRSDETKYSWTKKAEAFKIIYDTVSIVATKYTAYGFRQHTLNGEIQSNLAVAYYNKFALFPLFPCMATGNMSGIYQKMLDEGVDMMFMESAVKVGSQAPVKYDGNSISKPFNKYTQKFAFIRRQLNTDPEEGSLIHIGSQMVKIGLQNLRLERTNYVHNGTGKAVSGQELLGEFMSHIRRISEIGVQKVVDKFFKDGTTKYETGEIDPQKLSAYLKEQLGSRNVNKSTIEAIDLMVDDHGNIKLKSPLSATSDASWIESILISLINKFVIDINTPGSSFVQRSVFAIESKNGEGKIQGADFYNGQPLQMINEDGSMDAVVSVDYFKDIIPKGLSFAEARKWLLDNDIIGGNTNVKANTIGYRIPTQAQSSIHALRFIDVLPAAQATIILPSEFTKITGSDFDIDHLYLASYNYGKVNETVVTGGDNFEINSLSKTEGLTEEQLEQNGLLDCMMTLLKDVENSINCLYKSIDNDTDLPQSLSKQLPPAKSNKHLAYNFGTLHEQVERRNDYINGKKDIAPFALNATNHILTYLFGVKFKDTKFTKFTGIWHLDHLVDDNDAYISSWLSAFINANVDIVKDPWVVRLNVNPFTCNVLNLLIRSGVGQTGVWFLCQPIIRELADVEERTKSNFSRDAGLSKSKFKQKLIEEVLDKHHIWHDSEIISKYTTNSDAQSVQSKIDAVNMVLNNKEALRYIATNPDATRVKLADGSDFSVAQFQGQVYYAFLSLQKYIQAMNKLVQYTKIDTRKHGKNFIQIQRYLAMYNELFHPQDASKSLWDLESLSRLANGSWIEYKTVNAIQLPLRILANQVYTANQDFSSVVLHFARRLARSAGGEYGFTEDLIKTLSNGLQTAIKARYMAAYAKQVLGRSDEYIRELFYGSSPLISIARRLNGLKYAIESVPEFERLKGNYVIEKLRPQQQQQDVALSDGSVARQPQFITIDSNIDGSRTDENMMIDAWKDLLNDPNERVRMFAEDLILYTFFTTGESKGWNKLFKFVPSAWIRGEIRGGIVDVDGVSCTSFSDYVEQTLNGSMPSLIPMLQEVVSNNFLNYSMCPTVPLKNDDATEDKEATSNFMNPDALSPVLVANAVSISEIDSKPLYISIKKPNTKGRKASSYNVYKMTGEITMNDKVYPVYTIIEKRGYHQSNNDIFEYGIDLQYKENETKLPNGSIEEVESRIADACEKIANKAQYDDVTLNDALIDLTGAFYGESTNDDFVSDEQRSVPSKPSVIHQHKGIWTRSEVEKDAKSLYVFTDNTDRDSGSGLIDPNSRYAQKYGQDKHYPTRTQAVIRGLDNAMPISTQHWYHPGAKGATGVWTDNDFEEFKKTIDAEIQDIIDEWNTGKYERIVIGDGDAFFNSPISNISMERVPKLYSYLMSKIEELYSYVDEHKPESQSPQATSSIKYDNDGGASVEYTPTGKQRQTYTIKGNKIYNKNGDEVFKEDSVDRNKIFANLAVLQGRAVIIEHKGVKYVVNNRNQIISGATGKIMQWGEENGDRKAIIQAAEKRFKEKNVKAAMEKSVHEAHKDVWKTLGGDEQAESEINSTLKTAVAGVALSEVLDKIEPVFTKEEQAQIAAANKDKKLQVMSVSRMTDPVFFTKEIIKFLEENAKKPFTDPTRVNAIEIWSKHDGMPMQDLLRACKKYKVAPMISFSITGLGDTTLERGVMKYNDLLDRIEKLVQTGDLNPNTTTIRIDPILIGETNFEDVKAIINRCKQIGFKKFVTSLVQSYGYLDGTPQDRKVVSGINDAMQREGRTYDWDKYYGRITKEDFDISAAFVKKYEREHPNSSWLEKVSAGAAQGIRVVSKSSIGKIHFIPKQEYIDEIGRILLELNKDPEIELETCSFFIKGLRASACLDPLILERITGVDVTDANGRYKRDTSRPDCMCYGAHSDIFRMNEKRCFSSCAYCYAGKSDSNAISYYNEDGTLKDTVYTQTYEAEEGNDQQTAMQQNIEEGTKPVYSSEEQSIIDKAKKDGTFMKAPNGKPTKLTERQWVRARTKAFKDQFGDWEKEYTPQTNIWKENAWESYIELKDTGRTYIGHSGKTVPIELNKGLKYIHPAERVTPTNTDPFGFNSYRVNKLIAVGKEVDADRTFEGICQTTAHACKFFLKQRYGIESSVKIIKAKSPVKNDIIDHYVAVLSINGEAYIYDMPQTEYIKQTKPLVYDGAILDGYYEGVIVSKYTPRLIKATKENLSKFYEDDNRNDKQIKLIERTIKQLNEDGESVDLNNLQYKPAYDKNVSKAVDKNGEPLQQELIKQYPELAEVSQSTGNTQQANTSDNADVFKEFSDEDFKEAKEIKNRCKGN